MRWLKWALVAAWLGVHALLWTMLPLVPEVRVPSALSDTNAIPYSYLPVIFPAWTKARDGSSTSKITFADGGHLLVTRDSATVSVRDSATGQLKRVWEFGDTAKKIMGSELYYLVVSPHGDWAVVSNADVEPFLVDLKTGGLTRLDDLSVRFFAAGFSADGKHLVYLSRKPGAFWALCNLTLETGHVQVVKLANQPETFAISPDGRTVAVGVVQSYPGSRTSDTMFIGLEFVDLTAGKTVELDKLGYSGRWQTCRLSPDGKTVAATFTKRKPINATNYVVDCPCVATWDLSTHRRRATVEDAWFCGWCSDGRLVVRTSNDACFFADENLARHSDLPLPGPHSEKDDLSVSENGKFLLIKHVQLQTTSTGSWNTIVQFCEKWLKMNLRTETPAIWECFDLSGKKMATIPGWTGSCLVSPDGKYLAVGSPNDATVDVYTLPPRTPGGIVLGLMIVEVGLALVWTAWRRRNSRPKIVPDSTVKRTWKSLQVIWLLRGPLK